MSILIWKVIYNILFFFSQPQFLHGLKIKEIKSDLQLSYFSQPPFLNGWILKKTFYFSKFFKEYFLLWKFLKQRSWSYEKTILILFSLSSSSCRCPKPSHNSLSSLVAPRYLRRMEPPPYYKSNDRGGAKRITKSGGTGGSHGWFSINPRNFSFRYFLFFTFLFLLNNYFWFKKWFIIFFSFFLNLNSYTSLRGKKNDLQLSFFSQS